MRISKKGIDLIKSFEALELRAYQDIAGVWTIGWGHTGTEAATRGNVITVAQAEKLLRADLEMFEKGVSNSLAAPIANGWVSQNEFDALVSLAFNIGLTAFDKSTVVRRIRQGRPDGEVAESMLWWNKATINGKRQKVAGLVRRRKAEVKLYLTPDDKIADAGRVGTMTAGWLSKWWGGF